MPTYTFKLRDGDCGVEDDTGVILRDAGAALHYAQDVVHELMNCRELETSSWCLDVYENGDTRVFQIPFASVAPTLDHLTPEWRSRIEQASESRRAAEAATHAARRTVQEARAFLARGRLYLASDRGKNTIRDVSDS